MSETFEAMLTGGHPNSLGRTVEVVDLVLTDRPRLAELYGCYFSRDEVVRLRVSSAMKRVTLAHPDWTMELMDRLQDEVAAIDQASAQWTLALLFELTRPLLSEGQRARAVEIMQHNLVSHADWIVLNNSMKVLGSWAEDDGRLREWLAPQLRRLVADPPEVGRVQRSQAAASPRSCTRRRRSVGPRRRPTPSERPVSRLHSSRSLTSASSSQAA